MAGTGQAGLQQCIQYSLVRFDASIGSTGPLGVIQLSIYLSEVTSVSLPSGTVCYDILVVIAGLENNRLPNVQEIRRKSVHYPNYLLRLTLAKPWRTNS